MRPKERIHPHNTTVQSEAASAGAEAAASDPEDWLRSFVKVATLNQRLSV